MNSVAKITSSLQLGLPKGSMQAGVLELLAEAGIRTRTTQRSYRPSVALDRVDAKLLKPQTIVEMLAMGSRDIGFAARIGSKNWMRTWWRYWTPALTLCDWWRLHLQRF